MADEPAMEATTDPPEPTSAPAPAEPPAAAVAAAEAGGLAAGVGLAFGGATENLQDVVNVVFDVVQKQQVVIAATRAELDRQREAHERLKQQLADEMRAMQGELAAAREAASTGVAAPEPTKPFSVVVGSLPPTHSHDDTQKLLDTHTPKNGEAHAIAAFEAPLHAEKWAAAHQVLHFDTMAHAARAVKALHGRVHHAGPLPPATATFTRVGEASTGAVAERRPSTTMVEEETHPGTITATIMHNHRERHGFERQLLVRHVATATALDEVLAIVDEFLPASEPSSLDRFGLRVIRFPDRIDCLKAASALAGHFVCGARVEAGPVHAADSVHKLGAALQALATAGDEATRARTLVVSAAALDASKKSVASAFTEVERCDVHKAPGGFEFEIGCVVFESEAGLGRGLSCLDSARVGGGTVSGAPAVADRLVGRVATLEAGQRAILEGQGAFLDESDLADVARVREVQALAERVEGLEADLIAEIARRDAAPVLRSPEKPSFAEPPPQSPGASKSALDDLATRLDARVDALEDAIDALRDQRAQPVVMEASADVDEAGLISRATDATLLKLESVGVVVSEGESYELADDIRNDACITYCDAQAIEPLKELEQRVAANSQGISERLGREEFAGMCVAAAAGGETSLKPILDHVEALLVPIRETKADKADVAAQLAETEEKLHRACEDLKATLEAEQMKLFGEVRRTADQQGEKIEALEESLEDVRGQLGGDALKAFAAKQAKVDADLQAAVQLQHAGLEQATASLEHAMAILNELPDIDKVRGLVQESRDEVAKAVDEVTGALKLNLEGVRRDVARRTSREDVLHMLAKALREAMDRLRPHDDALMIGRAPVRCIACNSVQSNVHNEKAAKVIHGALSPTSATMPKDNHSRMNNVKAHRVVIQASYATGRAGALRPLVQSSTPGIPLAAPLSR